MRIRADEGGLNGIGLIEAIGSTMTVSNTPASGLDNRHPSANVPFVTGIMRKYPFVAPGRHQSTFIGNRAYGPETKAFFKGTQ